MKANLFGDGRYLGDNIAEKIQIHQLGTADNLGAEAALEVAYIADLNVHFGELFHGISGTYTVPFEKAPDFSANDGNFSIKPKVSGA